MPIPVTLIISFLLSTFLLFHFVDINTVYSSSEGPFVTPVIQWSYNLEGVFSYCVYEGVVTLESVNDPQAFCIIPTSDEPFENMQSTSNDDRNNYELTTQILPEDFDDTEEYTVCVTFSSTSKDIEDTIIEKCQTFNFEDNTQSQKPTINLDEAAEFIEDDKNVQEEEIKPNTKPGIPSSQSDNKEINDLEFPELSKNNISSLNGNELDRIPIHNNNNTNQENKTTPLSPSIGITDQF